MTETGALADLVAGYFHQDAFELYDDELRAVDDFVGSDSTLAASLLTEIDQALALHPSDKQLEDYLDRLGSQIGPEDGAYREWLTQIADHLRTIT